MSTVASVVPPARPTLATVPRVLSIAGSDPTGMAGIQADVKSIAANHGYAMAAVTALVAQNSHGIRAIHTPPAGFLDEQLRAVSDDITIDAVKIGMLGTAANVAVVGAWLAHVRPPIVVLDPVMIASSGRRLLDPDASDAIEQLLNCVDLVTPNLPELGALLQEPPADHWPAALQQAHRLSARHGVIVLVKGGHLPGPSSPDALVDAACGLGGGRALFELSTPRVASSNTRGTGCSLSSAIATLQAQCGDWTTSLATAKAWLLGSIRNADELNVGTGGGPVHHFYEQWKPRETGSERT